MAAANSHERGDFSDGVLEVRWVIEGPPRRIKTLEWRDAGRGSVHVFLTPRLPQVLRIEAIIGGKPTLGSPQLFDCVPPTDEDIAQYGLDVSSG